MPDVLFILILALIIFGPKRLPEVMRQVAKFMAQFRSMSDDLKRQIRVGNDEDRNRRAPEETRHTRAIAAASGQPSC